MQIDPASLPTREVYALLTSAIVPRPIAWLGTRSAEGVDNLAPFSYFMGVGSRPPSLAVSVARARGAGGLVLKDTARNILDTEVFTVSIVSRPRVRAMAVTAGRWPPEADEFAEAGLRAVPGTRVDAPWPEGARVAMECRLLRHVDLDTTSLFVGEVLLVHVDEAALAADGRTVDPRALDPVGRLGGDLYASLGELFAVRPPAVDGG